jgi:hypothetical protein
MGDRIAREVRTMIRAVAVALALCIASHGSVGQIFDSSRPGTRYLIPDGYVGWVRIDYGVNDAHAPGFGVPRALPLPVDNGVVIAQIPAHGHLVTSSPMRFGGARDEYYYVANGTRKTLSQAQGSSMIWNKFNGRLAGAAMQTEMFFIGSEADYMKHGYRHEPVPRPGPVTH